MNSAVNDQVPAVVREALEAANAHDTAAAGTNQTERARAGPAPATLTPSSQSDGYRLS